ncbi:MAG: hypothetical protein U9R75_05055 [Candidatus Thermoplasmatota archaeon]|nr:hypothetical protein [Candidatus Thermoplasmatota archaeon]
MINRILIQYNLPRYPGTTPLDEVDIRRTIEMIDLTKLSGYLD